VSRADPPRVFDPTGPCVITGKVSEPAGEKFAVSQAKYSRHALMIDPFASDGRGRLIEVWTAAPTGASAVTASLLYPDGKPAQFHASNSPELICGAGVVGSGNIAREAIINGGATRQIFQPGGQNLSSTHIPTNACDLGQFTYFKSRFELKPTAPCGEYQVLIVGQVATSLGFTAGVSRRMSLDVVCRAQFVLDVKKLVWPMLKVGENIILGDTIADNDRPTIINTGNVGIIVETSFGSFRPVSTSDGGESLRSPFGAVTSWISVGNEAADGPRGPAMAICPGVHAALNISITTQRAGNSSEYVGSMLQTGKRAISAAGEAPACWQDQEQLIPGWPEEELLSQPARL
jgi:hypothetical protein